jgi:hypothetical protein
MIHCVKKESVLTTSQFITQDKSKEDINSFCKDHNISIMINSKCQKQFIINMGKVTYLLSEGDWIIKKRNYIVQVLSSQRFDELYFPIQFL